MGTLQFCEALRLTYVGRPPGTELVEDRWWRTSTVREPSGRDSRSGPRRYRKTATLEYIAIIECYNYAFTLLIPKCSMTEASPTATLPPDLDESQPALPQAEGQAMPL